MTALSIGSSICKGLASHVQRRRRHLAEAVATRSLQIDSSAKPRYRIPAAIKALAVVLLLAMTVAMLLADQSPEAPRNLRRAGTTDPIGDRHPVRPLPGVQPVVFESISPKTAQAVNASTPFAPFGTDRPMPFNLAPASPDYLRALDCLASEMSYEAGDNVIGQSAVAQVVLNRMRHPAFPHTVCAVVYQGSERTTGCQFTFTCDGALQRQPTNAAWQRARRNAARFLAGTTDPSVGMATHYHTDWVHPYWSPSLDKIARHDTHLFFRWRGFWGQRAAFLARYAGGEPQEVKLASLSDAHRDPVSAVPLLSPAGLPARSTGDDKELLSMVAGDHFILVDAHDDGGELAMQGLRQCSGQTYCKVVGWDRRAAHYGSPEMPLIRSVAFLYVRDQRTKVEVVLWDCTRYNRPADAQCLSDANRRWIKFQGNLSHAS